MIIVDQFSIISHSPLNNLTPASSLLKNRSPNRHTKSRWELLPEEKLVEEQTTSTIKYNGAIHHNERKYQVCPFLYAVHLVLHFAMHSELIKAFSQLLKYS